MFDLIRCQSRTGGPVERSETAFFMNKEMLNGKYMWQNSQAGRTLPSSSIYPDGPPPPPPDLICPSQLATWRETLAVAIVAYDAGGPPVLITKRPARMRRRIRRRFTGGGLHLSCPDWASPLKVLRGCAEWWPAIAFSTAMNKGRGQRSRIPTSCALSGICGEDGWIRAKRPDMELRYRPWWRMP